jgi:choline kinase
MRAIILAAGIGARLQHANQTVKCLLEFGGKTLLERHVENLNAIGVSQIHLCLGHKSNEVRQFVQSKNISNIFYHFNPLFRLGSLVSLWAVRKVLLSGEEIILMDADVLYDPTILYQLVNSPYSNCFLIDKNYVAGEEPVKICVKNKKIIEFRKKLPKNIDYDEIGESVGFFKFSEAACAALDVIISRLLSDNQHQLPHEEALRELTSIDRYNIGVQDITGLPWIEIDYPEDVTRAQNEILPEILTE